MAKLAVKKESGDVIDLYKEIAETLNSGKSVDTRIITSDSEISVQNPLPTDGDSVYPKDLIIDLSDEGDFVIPTEPTADKTRILSSLVGDVHIEKKNDTINNPKSITLTFQRPILTSSFGIDGGPNGNFSNTKITIFQGQTSQVVIDESLDDTKHLIRLFDIFPIKFSKIKIEFYTADAVSIGLIGIFKNTEVASRIESISELTQTVEPINSFRNALQVDSALVHKQGVNLFFFKEDSAETTLAVETTTENTSITVVDSTDFTIGDKVRLTGAILTGQSFMIITNIVGNVITLDRPIGSVLSIGNAVDVVLTNLNVNGSLNSPVIFKISPPTGTEGPLWQLTRLLISITDATTMDDGKFGGGIALTNGVNLRIVKGDGTIQNLTNWKNNGDFALDMFDVTYTDKAPAGQYGLRGRWTFTKAQFIVELDGTQGDYLELRVQDNLTDLSSFEIKGQGRLFGA